MRYAYLVKIAKVTGIRDLFHGLADKLKRALFILSHSDTREFSKKII
jgi:hypothetical protein